jgi:hypothetical protein
MNDRGWSNERLVQRATGLAGRGFRFAPRSRFGDKRCSLASHGSNHWTFPRDCFVAAKRRNNSLPDETISCFGADIRKQRMVIKPPTKRRATPALKTGDSQMRTLSFILAFAFVLAPSVAGLSDSLPGIGTFAYNGSPIATSAPQALMVAAN